MADDDFRVEVIGHATLRIRSRGRTVVTDPWLLDPMIGDGGFHFPPLIHDPADVAADVDAIWLSHPHPDHFHRASLALFRRDTPVYIGHHRRSAFRDQLHALGFPVVEVPFGEPTRIAGTDVEIAIVEHDYEETAAYDSALVLRTPDFTLFDNNDCVLRPEKLAWVRDRFAVDYAFLGYSPASFFPICFEMSAAEKARLLAEASERRYRDFVDAACALRPRLAIPFASGLRFLHTATLWKNVLFNSASEAVRRLDGTGVAGVAMGPGDRLGVDGAIRRAAPVLDRDAELAAIAAHAETVQPWIASLARTEPPVRADLLERFRAHVLQLRRRTRTRLPGVDRWVIAFVIVGAEEQRCWFDFSRPDAEAFQWGTPARYDMRYTYPASGLQRALDGDLDWDEFHFTSDVSVHQIAYAKEFYAMLRSETLDLADGPETP